MTKLEKTLVASWTLIGVGIVALFCGIWSGGIPLMIGYLMQRKAGLSA